MKWLIACLLTLCVAVPVLAGEDPYIAVVGNDIDANPFYLSEKHQQFLLDQTVFGVPTTFERFRSQFPVIQPEVCDTLPPVDDTTRGNLNARATAGNKGWFDWVIRLPKKPSGEINICIQCGVLKPNTEIFGPEAIEFCAAETGERVGDGFCTRDSVPAGYDPIIPGALPRLVAIAFPGPYNKFTPFYLTAYKNPGTYKLPFWSLNGQIKSGGDTQILDGGTSSRILLKACMDKCVVVKIPTNGQQNAGTTVPLDAFPSIPTCCSPFNPSPGSPPFCNVQPGDICIPSTGLSSVETDLVQGDLIYVRMIVPSANTVDIFCHAESAKIMGIGESAF